MVTGRRDKMNKELSNRIQELRKVKGYTQKDFADLIGVGQSTVANYEKGIRIPDTIKLYKIANLFGVTVDYLLGRDVKNIHYRNETKTTAQDFQYSDDTYKIFLNHLLNGNKEQAKLLINAFYNKGIGIREIYFHILERTQKEVGALWERGSIDVWKEHFISETVLDIMREIKLREKKTSGETYSMIALTCGAEQHNIGLRMLVDILELEGWNITYIGSNVPVISLIKAIEAKKPEIVAISATLPYHIESAGHAITAIRNHFEKKAPKIIVGGTAFLNCENPCENTGADFYGTSVDAIKKAVTSK
jgi:MerR family transcriptional regulator, light-induced transcriptional regulator